MSTARIAQADVKNANAAFIETPVPGPNSLVSRRFYLRSPWWIIVVYCAGCWFGAVRSQIFFKVESVISWWGFFDDHSDRLLIDMSSNIGLDSCCWNIFVDDKWFVILVASTGCFVPTVSTLCGFLIYRDAGTKFSKHKDFGRKWVCISISPCSQVSNEWCTVALGSMWLWIFTTACHCILFRVASGTMAPNYFLFWRGFICMLHFLYVLMHSKFETLFVQNECVCNFCGHAPCVSLPLWFEIRIYAERFQGSNLSLQWVTSLLLIETIGLMESWFRVCYALIWLGQVLSAMEGEVLVGGSTLCCEMATHLEHLKCPIVFF